MCPCSYQRKCTNEFIKRLTSQKVCQLFREFPHRRNRKRQDKDNLSRYRLHESVSKLHPVHGKQLDNLRECQNPSKRFVSRLQLRRLKSIPLSSCGPYLRFLARGYHIAVPFSGRRVFCRRRAPGIRLENVYMRRELSMIELV